MGAPKIVLERCIMTILPNRRVASSTHMIILDIISVRMTIVRILIQPVVLGIPRPLRPPRPPRPPFPTQPPSQQCPTC